jgi:hypothetical protein
MIDLALFIALLVLGIRAFLALRKSASVLREFGRSALLTGLVLAYPLAPVAILLAPSAVSRVAIYCGALLFFAGAFWFASKQRDVLDRAGTDRVKWAMEATSTASLGALVGIIYVCLSGTFALLGASFASRPFGA